jgi:hypothetical protein
MHPSYVPIDAAMLKTLYVDQELTTVEIAAQLGCGATTISRRLQRFRIPVRPRGSRPQDRPHGGIAGRARWSSELAYAVGLIATDGNLSPDGRHLAIPSKDFQLLESFRCCLKLENRIVRRVNGRGHIYRLQWGDKSFYDWLLSIGLTPAKSLTLGQLAVPDDYFADFFRGYERLYVSLVSGSRPFLSWIRRTIHRLLGVGGSIKEQRRPGRRPTYALRYAKVESIQLLTWMYRAPHGPCLVRKRNKAGTFLPATTICPKWQ